MSDVVVVGNEIPKPRARWCGVFPVTATTRRGTGIALAGTVLCGLLAACGGGPAGPAASPSAAPTAPVEPSPSAVSFLHVLHGSSVATYAIDATSGRLQLAATQDTTGAHALTGKPDGRFVYAGYGPRTGHGDSPTIVAYAAGEHGGLVLISEMSSLPPPSPRDYGDERCHSGWSWLSASSDRVYALWHAAYCSSGYEDVFTYATHGISSQGDLGPAYSRDFPEDADLGQATVDVRANVLYKASTYSSGLTAHLVGENGQLTQMGWSDLCVASKTGAVMPLVAVGGLVLGSASTGGGEGTVCSWEGLRLAPRANLDLRSSAGAAVVPPGDAARAFVALATAPGHDPYATYHEVRLFAMSGDGGLRLLDTKDTPGDADVVQLVFHPSGRCLYVSDRIQDSGGSTVYGLRAYSIGVDGRLEMIDSLDGAGGRGWSAPPYSSTYASTMAVSVRGSIPQAPGQ